MKPPTPRTVDLVRPTDAAPPQHGDGAHAVALSAPVPIPTPDDAVLKFCAALCWPVLGRTVRKLVLDRLISDWSGNADVASRVADVLVTNAAEHAGPLDGGEIPLRLLLLPDSQLLIEVDDGTPEFPDFHKAQAEAPIGRGLWWVSHYRGRLTYFPLLNDQGKTVGKTVQVLLPVTWGEAA